MRMIRNRLDRVPLYKQTERDSDYVGTETVWAPAGEVLADVQPGEDSFLRDEYGEHAQNMIVLYMERGVDIQNGYGAFALGANRCPTHRITSVKPYKFGHIVAVAELEVAADG